MEVAAHEVGVFLGIEDASAPEEAQDVILPQDIFRLFMYLPASAKQAEVNFFVGEEGGVCQEGSSCRGEFGCYATSRGKNVGVDLGAELSW